jgi:hypothetical protein
MSRWMKFARNDVADIQPHQMRAVLAKYGFSGRYDEDGASHGIVSRRNRTVCN